MDRVLFPIYGILEMGRQILLSKIQVAFTARQELILCSSVSKVIWDAAARLQKILLYQEKQQTLLFLLRYALDKQSPFKIIRRLHLFHRPGALGMVLIHRK